MNRISQAFFLRLAIGDCVPHARAAFWVLVGAWLVLGVKESQADQATEAHRLFKKFCVECHGDSDPEAGLRLDQLMVVDKGNSEVWESVAHRVETGDMPPEESPQPSSDEIRAFVDWISGELQQTLSPLPALRRMNRREYEYTIHDLLGVNTPLESLLPEDGQVQGFDNVAEGLGISSILMDRYLEAADVAFEDVIRRVRPLPAEARRAELMKVKDNIASVKGHKGGVIESAGAFVDFTPGWPPSRIDPAHPIEAGIYRCRIAVWPHEPGEHRTLSVGVFSGPLFGPGKRHFNGMFDVTGDAQNPRVIEFTTHLDAGESLHILPWVFPEHVTWRDKNENRPGVAIAWAETYGPLDQAFPSLAQRRLFGDSDSMRMEAGDFIKSRYRKRVPSHHVESSQPREDIRRILNDFAPRAFRRPVEQEMVDQFVDLAHERLTLGNRFEDSVRAGVTAILCSPHFLLLNSEAHVDDYSIASRLSYFLWSSLPDQELLSLAAAGKLSDPKVRYQQVERMIEDPKFERFIKSFTGQWLDLKEIEFTTPDKVLYPEYDELLLRSMLNETHRFFEHLVREDLSVLNIVDSDFAILNQRLAMHYGIPDVVGHEQFRLVALPEDSVRGGLLTQASVLKVTANGTTTSPVLRGIWLLDRILGQPPPPPPPGVPAVEPDIRGAISIRDQLVKHREIKSCNRCHEKIDPPGFALEEFDVIGGHRQWYRSLSGKGKRVGKTRYYAGANVDSADVLPDGRQFNSFSEFQKLLMADREIIAEAFAKKLLIYACGRPVGRAEQESVQSVMDATRDGGFGVRQMIHAVVETKLFHQP